MAGIPNIHELPERPILQTLVSKDCWVRVVFYKQEGATRSEIFRTMELLEMMHNGWTKEQEVMNAANTQSSK